MITLEELAGLGQLLNRAMTIMTIPEQQWSQAILNKLSVGIAEASKPIDMTEAEVVEKK